MIRDIRDQRDPGLLGRALEAITGKSKLSMKYDRHAHTLARVPDYHDPSTSLERYGDPVVRHQERIDAGIEVVLS